LSNLVSFGTGRDGCANRCVTWLSLWVNVLRDISTAEQRVCEHLSRIFADALVGDTIDDTGPFRNLLTALQFFIPEVLREIHNEWKGESLDGVYPRIARRTGYREIEIVGLCCLISDQTLTPLHIRVQTSPATDHVAWVDCRLGEHTGDGMRREPYGSSKVQGAMLHVLERLDSIDWFYHVGYGERIE
jgi:hypothetical protein